MMDKVRYFLKIFKNLEWSGPAWYSHEKDENGFPTNIKLEYFHPLDLGSSAATDWDGGDLIEIYKDLRKEFPEIGKTWVQGNIHSHHNMGAFFSGTDVQQCVDGANENFYYSLVVSTKPEKELFFGVSYPDQFGQIHVTEIDDIEVDEVRQYCKTWKQQAHIIKENKKPETIVTTGMNYRHGYNNQGTLFAGETPATPEQTKQERYEEHVDMLSYNSTNWQEADDDPMSWEHWEKYDELMLDYERGRMKKGKFMKALKKLGVDENGFPIPT